LSGRWQLGAVARHVITSRPGRGSTFDDFLFTPQASSWRRDPSTIDLTSLWFTGLSLKRPIKPANMTR
jgi:hypothetical protein